MTYGGGIDINYELNWGYTNFPPLPQTAARISWPMGISTGLTEGTHTPKFGQGDEYTNPPLLDLIFALYLYGIFTSFLSLPQKRTKSLGRRGAPTGGRAGG